MDINYFIENQKEFTRKDKSYECEIPKGNCWRITVKHDKTGGIYEYYEEDCYYSLKDQLNDSMGNLELTKVSE
jgi:hypothetical protein|tara:strand:+ start:85 stop:303 length:219 start_codon:yes stop_codon:yes gene_type:complete